MSIKKLIIILLVFLILISVPAFSRERVAVLDFEAKEVEEDDARAIADLFRSDLVSTGEFIVLERGNMQSILDEHALTMKGLTNEASASEIGELLSVNYLFLGNLSKFGNKFLLVIDKINVETGEIENSVKKNALNMDDFLALSAEAAEELSGGEVASDKQDDGYDVETITGLVAEIGFFSLIDMKKIDFETVKMQNSDIDLRRKIQNENYLDNAGLCAGLNFLSLGFNAGSFIQGFNAMGYTGVASSSAFLISLLATDSLALQVISGLAWTASWLGSVITPFWYEETYNQQLKDTLLVY